jgi:hypothetical protein
MKRPRDELDADQASNKLATGSHATFKPGASAAAWSLPAGTRVISSLLNWSSGAANTFFIEGGVPQDDAALRSCAMNLKVLGNSHT